MNKFLLTGLLFILVGCGSKADYPWFAGDFESAQAEAKNKPIMLYFYADW